MKKNGKSGSSKKNGLNRGKKNGLKLGLTKGLGAINGRGAINGFGANLGAINDEPIAGRTMPALGAATAAEALLLMMKIMPINTAATMIPNAMTFLVFIPFTSFQGCPLGKMLVSNYLHLYDSLGQN